MQEGWPKSRCENHGVLRPGCTKYMTSVALMFNILMAVAEIMSSSFCLISQYVNLVSQRVRLLLYLFVKVYNEASIVALLLKPQLVTLTFCIRVPCKHWLLCFVPSFLLMSLGKRQTIAHISELVPPLHGRPRWNNEAKLNCLVQF